MSEQLWMLCEHGEVKPHPVIGKERPSDVIPSYLKDCPGGHPVEGGEKVWWCEDCKTATPTVTAIHRIHHADSLVERFLIPLPNTETTK